MKMKKILMTLICLLFVSSSFAGRKRKLPPMTEQEKKERSRELYLEKKKKEQERREEVERKRREEELEQEVLLSEQREHRAYRRDVQRTLDRLLRPELLNQDVDNCDSAIEQDGLVRAAFRAFMERLMKNYNVSNLQQRQISGDYGAQGLREHGKSANGVVTFTGVGEFELYPRFETEFVDGEFSKVIRSTIEGDIVLYGNNELFEYLQSPTTKGLLDIFQNILGIESKLSIQSDLSIPADRPRDGVYGPEAYRGNDSSLGSLEYDDEQFLQEFARYSSEVEQKK